MKAISYSKARADFARNMERVCKDHAPVVITRRKEDAVVMISLADYEALEETAYLLRSPRNARRLLSSLEKLNSGKGRERKLVE